MSSKKGVARAFGESFLRTTVIILAFIIVAFAAFFIIKLAAGGSKNKVDANPQGTEAVADTTEPGSSEDVTPVDPNASEDVAPAEGEDDAVVTEAPTEEPATEAIASTDLKIFVLNSTKVTGLAGAWADKLKSQGYTKVYTGNYKGSSLSDTKISVSADGMGSDLKGLFSNASVETGLPSKDLISLTDGSVDASSADIVIIIGSNDNIMQ